MQRSSEPLQPFLLVSIRRSSLSTRPLPQALLAAYSLPSATTWRLHLLTELLRTTLEASSPIMASKSILEAPLLGSRCARLVGLVADEGNDHAVQVEEEHQQVETQLDERFLKNVSTGERRLEPGGFQHSVPSYGRSTS